MRPKGSTIQLESSDGQKFGCYHVQPTGTRKGGLVLIQEIFGVTNHIKELCDEYADRGFQVLAPQLFDRLHKDFQVGYTADGIEAAKKLAGENSWDHVVADVQTCINQLTVSGPAYITGYCYGGSVSWVAACRCSGLAAASGYYGRLVVDFVDETPKCPIILHFGENDASIPMSDVEKVRAAHPDVPVYVYNAGHGFNSNRRSDYHKPSADLALKRTLELFAVHR